jgi:hypothetical protein
MKGDGMMISKSAVAASKLAALTAFAIFGWGTGATAQGVKPVGVLITPPGPNCPHRLSHKGHKLEKDKDSLGWGIMNVCGQEQKVLVCVYKGEISTNPFAPCQSSVPGADVGKVFVVPSRAFPVTTLTCLATGQEGSYTKVVFTGADVPVPNPVCPPTPPSPEPSGRPETWTHRLDVEIWK